MLRKGGFGQSFYRSLPLCVHSDPFYTSSGSVSFLADLAFSSSIPIEGSLDSRNWGQIGRLISSFYCFNVEINFQINSIYIFEVLKNNGWPIQRAVTDLGRRLLTLSQTIAGSTVQCNRIRKTPSVWRVWHQTCQTLPDFHIWCGDIMTLPTP